MCTKAIHCQQNPLLRISCHRSYLGYLANEMRHFKKHFPCVVRHVSFIWCPLVSTSDSHHKGAQQALSSMNTGSIRALPAVTVATTDLAHTKKEELIFYAQLLQLALQQDNQIGPFEHYYSPGSTQSHHVACDRKKYW